MGDDNDGMVVAATGRAGMPLPDSKPARTRAIAARQKRRKHCSPLIRSTHAHAPCRTSRMTPSPTARTAATRWRSSLHPAPLLLQAAPQPRSAGCTTAAVHCTCHWLPSPQELLSTPPLTQHKLVQRRPAPSHLGGGVQAGASPAQLQRPCLQHPHPHQCTQPGSATWQAGKLTRTASSSLPGACHNTPPDAMRCAEAGPYPPQDKPATAAKTSPTLLQPRCSLAQLPCSRNMHAWPSHCTNGWPGSIAPHAA